MDLQNGELPTKEERQRWNRVAGIVVAETRHELGIKQKALAHRLGWTPAMLSNLERGRHPATLPDLLLIASVLKVSPELLLQRILLFDGTPDSPWYGPFSREQAARGVSIPTTPPSHSLTCEITQSKTADVNGVDIPHEAVKQAFGDILHCLRFRLGLSQQRLAAQTQIERAYISCMERARREPTIGMLFRISPALQVSPASLVRLTAARLSAMQHPSFDRSSSPLTPECASLALTQAVAGTAGIPTIRQAIAMVVRAIRLRTRCNHRAFAKRAALDSSYETQVEKGEINPTLTTMLRLAAAASLPAEVVLQGVQFVVYSDLNKQVLSQWLRSLYPRNHETDGSSD